VCGNYGHLHRRILRELEFYLACMQKNQIGDRSEEKWEIGDHASSRRKKTVSCLLFRIPRFLPRVRLSVVSTSVHSANPLHHHQHQLRNQKVSCTTRTYIFRTLVSAPKSGDLTNCSNYRGLTLLPSINKLFTNLLLQRLSPHVSKGSSIRLPTGALNC
jgi:hypothetical protein